MQETRSARKLKSVNSDLTILFVLWVKKRKKKYINNFLTISIEFFFIYFMLCLDANSLKKSYSFIIIVVGVVLLWS